MSNLKIAIAVALVYLVVAITPASRWVVQSTLDFWFGKFGNAADGLYFNQSLLEVQPGGNPITQVAPMLNRQSPPQQEKDSLDAWVREFLKTNERNPEALGVLLRWMSGGEKWTKVDRFRKTQADGPRVRLLLDVCRKSQSADPDNLLPVILKAFAYDALKQPAESRAALLEAATKRHYSSYAFTEAQETIALMESKFGYRSNNARIAIYAGLAFPHLARIRELGSRVLARNSLEERVALTSVGLTMMRSSEAVIDLMVGQHLIRLAQGIAKPAAAHESGQLSRALTNFRGAVEGQGIVVPYGLWTAVEKVNNAKFDLRELAEYEFEPKPTFLATSGSLLIYAIALALILRNALKDRVPQRSKHFPALQSLGVYVISPVLIIGAPLLGSVITVNWRASGIGDAWMPILFGVSSLLGIIVARRRLRETICTIFLCLACLLLVGGTFGMLRGDESDKAVLTALESEGQRVKVASGLSDL